jgi:Tetracyclin repressor-like, C-terminal domain
VPLTANDLPGYAVRLYDAYLARPRLVRLASWARLERTPAGHLFAEASEEPKVQAIAQAQRDGHIDPGPPGRRALNGHLTRHDLVTRQPHLHRNCYRPRR